MEGVTACSSDHVVAELASANSMYHSMRLTARVRFSAIRLWLAFDTSGLGGLPCRFQSSLRLGRGSGVLGGSLRAYYSTC